LPEQAEINEEPIATAAMCMDLRCAAERRYMDVILKVRSISPQFMPAAILETSIRLAGQSARCAAGGRRRIHFQFPGRRATISEHFDVCVIGGGMAGLSAAAGLAAARKVVLVEREPHWAYHSTGRSAALFAESYGNPAVRALTRASRNFYLAADRPRPFTQPRGALFVATAAQREALETLYEALSSASLNIALLGPEAALKLCPALRIDTLSGAVLDPDARDIDVAAVVDLYVREFRSNGGRECRDTEVFGLEHSRGEWQIHAGNGRIRASVVINAAGAWADEVARAAGVAPAGLEPRRRTAVRVSAAPWAVAQWPFVVDVAEQWYFRADAGALLLSPADETPSAPCDVQPDDYDVALAIERIEAATRLVVERPLSTWAGLRTFTADRTPVIGFDPDVSDFYWLAGQGGYGIQTAPALAQLVVAQVTGLEAPAALAAAASTRPPCPLRACGSHWMWYILGHDKFAKMRRMNRFRSAMSAGERSRTARR
jgi:D-arginine dehydrogenase